ncbi:MAG: amidase [Acidimicrobiia bacterium]|nr:amidase [Acidimicrobiia bacterium]
MKVTEYRRYDAVGLAELIANRQISAPEALDVAIRQTEALNPALNAVVHTTYDRARRLAQAPLPATPLAGVPFMLKDLGQLWEGVPTTSGSRALSDFIAPITTTLTSRYLRGGLVILGKTSTPEFGMASVTEPAMHGPTNNPWAPGITAGGSSGGSASVVAAGVVPAAHASDGGGSIRIPSYACGLVGLKPTRGRNPVGPVMSEGWYGLAASHVVTRTVRDSAAFLDLSHGPEAGDPYAAPPPDGPYRQAVQAPGRSLRVGVVDGAMTGDVNLDPECLRAVDRTASLLEELGHRVDRVSTGIGPGPGRRAMLTLSAVDIAWMVGTFGIDVTKLEPANQVVVEAGKTVSATDFADNLYLVRHYGRIMGGIMEDHDVLVTSTLASPPWPHFALQPGAEQRERIAALLEGRYTGSPFELMEEIAAKSMDRIPNTWPFNMTGQPAVSLPIHRAASGRPVGVQFVGRFGREDTLFNLAAQLEEARPWIQDYPFMNPETPQWAETDRRTQSGRPE